VKSSEGQLGSQAHPVSQDLWYDVLFYVRINIYDIAVLRRIQSDVTELN